MEKKKKKKKEDFSLIQETDILSERERGQIKNGKIWNRLRRRKILVCVLPTSRVYIGK